MKTATYQNQVSAGSKLFSTKSVYLLLVIIGSIAPWSLLLKFIIHNGFSISLLIEKAFVNYSSTVFVIDLLICILTFFCFAFFELKRLGLSRSRLIIYIAATFGVGLSCSLPLFLYFREKALDKKS